MVFSTTTNRIFRLTTTLSELQRIPRPECVELFTELMAASLRGLHLVVIDRAVCQWAAETLVLAEHHSEHLKTLKGKYSTLGAIADVASAHLTVTIGNAPLEVLEPRRYSIGHEALLASSMTQRAAALIVEDTHSDGRMYRHLLSEAVKLTNIPSFNMDIVHGGGAQVVRVFESEITRKVVVVGIIDSDKNAPCDRKSGTCNNVINLRNSRRNDFVGDVFVGPWREVENIIPLHILRTISAYRSIETEPLQRLIDSIVDEDKALSLWDFLDLKEGFDGALLIQKRGTEAISQDTLNWILDKLNVDATSLSTIKVQGVGSNLIDAFLGCDKSLSAFHSYIRTGSWRTKYLPLFEDLLWFCCAPREQRT